jgi:hypothetical protein
LLKSMEQLRSFYDEEMQDNDVLMSENVMQQIVQNVSYMTVE